MRELLSSTCARIGRSFLAFSSYLGRPATVPPQRVPEPSSSALAEKPSALPSVQSAEQYPGRIQYRFSVEVLGQRVGGKCGKDATLAALRLFASLDPACLPRLRKLTQKRCRVYVSDNPAEMYPARSSHLAAKRVEFAPGWFMITNIGDKEMCTILRAACEATGLEYGKDVRASF